MYTTTPILLGFAETPWNKGRLIGQKRPLKPKEVWAIRVRLQLEERKRDLALFNLAIDSKLRGCDLVSLRVEDVCVGSRARDRATVIQKKTGRPVQFEITEQTRSSIRHWLSEANLISGQFYFQAAVEGSRISRHANTRESYMPGSRVPGSTARHCCGPAARWGRHSHELHRSDRRGSGRAARIWDRVQGGADLPSERAAQSLENAPHRTLVARSESNKICERRPRSRGRDEAADQFLRTGAASRPVPARVKSISAINSIYCISMRGRRGCGSSLH
jgi:hypothetical protein